MARSLSLAQALVLRLRPVAPEGISVEVEAGGVAIFQPGIPHSRSVVRTGEILDDSDDGRSDREKLDVAAYSVLNHFQDFIAEFIATPWPGIGSQLPEPHVEVGTETIRLWFGSRAAPELELDPIPLAELE